MELFFHYIETYKSRRSRIEFFKHNSQNFNGSIFVKILENTIELLIVQAFASEIDGEMQVN